VKESDYILVSNKSAIGTAIQAMRDVMSGEEYGVDEKKRAAVMVNLSEMQDSVFGIITRQSDSEP
jgi:hypothetical protein